MIKIARIIERANNSFGAEKNHKKSGKLSALKIDAKETYPETKKTATQTKIDNPKAGRKLDIPAPNAINAPKLTAIPLPPLNFKKMVQL